jgi:tryptophanyl-tRNA synthetase
MFIKIHKNRLINDDKMNYMRDKHNIDKSTFIVTPWEVKGIVDYKKLTEQFGINPLSEKILEEMKKYTKDLHYFLERKIFFAHRDLDWLLDEYKKGNKFYLYTGRGPSGHTHLGHLVPWIFTKWLQDKFDAKLYFQITDDEKFLFKDELDLEKVKSFAYENVLDIISLGFDHRKTFIFLDTEYAKTLYKEAIKVAKHITFSTSKAVFGFKNESNIGQIFFTSVQAVPAFLESVKQGKNVPCLIPLAVDQDPHFRVARDVLPKLGYYKPSIIHCKFLPSLGKEGKMSASKPETTIFTTDTSEQIEIKIRNAYDGGQPTIKEQKEKGGNPDICPIYQYYFFLFEQDNKKLEEIYSDCKTGKRICGECKEILLTRVKRFISEHQEKREKAKNIVDKFMLRD